MIELRIRGRKARVPGFVHEGRTIIVKSRLLGIATIHDEVWHERPVHNPETFISAIKGSGLGAHIFSFSQRIPDTTPLFPHFFHEFDNVAVIPLSSFSDWWENRLPQETRKNTRKSAKQGVAVRLVQLDDKFFHGVTAIYNETPIRQGRRFSKYGFNFETVKEEVTQLQDRSEYIGAFVGDELVGFIKLVYLGDMASILSINSLAKYADKKPTNALIAKAVEVSCERGMKYLLYGKYIYGRKVNSMFTEFKRRNGFEQQLVPTYYVPLDWVGRLIITLRLHRGLLFLLPAPVLEGLVAARGKLLHVFTRA